MITRRSFSLDVPDTMLKHIRTRVAEYRWHEMPDYVPVGSLQSGSLRTVCAEKPSPPMFKLPKVFWWLDKSISNLPNSIWNFHISFSRPDCDKLAARGGG